LFTSRQIVGLTTLHQLVGEARLKVIEDFQEVDSDRDGRHLRDGGHGANGYADAVATYLGLSASRQVNRGCTLNFWDNTSQKIQQVFGRQAFAMTWDFVETNFFSDSTGNFLDQLEFPAKSVAAWMPGCPEGFIQQIDAANNGFPIRPALFSTDPPYYDNIGYATLSDFFYVWLRSSIGNIWPELFRRITTPKDVELVATSYRHGGKVEAETFFRKGMASAFTAIRGAAVDEAPIAIYYAFKQSEPSVEGASSTGWASFLQGVFDSGLLIDGTWPVRTELTGNLKNKINVLASSIVLICRKRSDAAEITTRSEFIRALKREMPTSIDKIRKAGVGPVDMPQSIIGPGMGIFTRYAQVLEDDDSLMSVKTALALINRVWGEIENDLDANFDPETQVALAWFATYGFDARSSGDLINLATAKNISIESLFRSGVFENLHGKAGLIPRERLERDWSPATDKTVTVWECVQHTARVLRAEDGGAEAAAKLVAAMGPRAEDARALTYRLYEIASQKAWAAEALVYNEVAQEWAHLDTLAADVDRSTRGAEPARDLFGEIAR
jgi:putative DNA methylase